MESMTGLRNSAYGKRLRASALSPEPETPRKRRRHSTQLIGEGEITSEPPSTPVSTGRRTPMNSVLSSRLLNLDDSPASPWESPSLARSYSDRFIPMRESEDVRTPYHLKESEEKENMRRKSTRLMDAVTMQADELFSSVLRTETVASPAHSSPGTNSPLRRTPLGNTPLRHSRSLSLPRRKLFQYANPPSAPSREALKSLDSPISDIYSTSNVSTQGLSLLEAPRLSPRMIPKLPYRVLDAPGLQDDYYLDVIDWSSTNILAAGLASCVYLLDTPTHKVSMLCNLKETHSDSVGSVAWTQKGSTLGVGSIDGRLLLYDAKTQQLTRTYEKAHDKRIGVLAWNDNIVTSGSRDCSIQYRDIREAGSRPFHRVSAHHQEVCGLKWSEHSGAGGGRLLASGGNDNKVCVWDLRGSSRAGASSSSDTLVGESSTDVAPVWKFHNHKASVKALAWDPHVNGMLATGGGTADKHIRVFNTQHGTLAHEIDTGSQVCNLMWSTTSHELVSTHGFPSPSSNKFANNRICIWKHPFELVASLTGHMSRVLFLAMGPDGSSIVTGSGDETLRFWTVFPGKADIAKEYGADDSLLDYSRQIR